MLRPYFNLKATDRGRQFSFNNLKAEHVSLVQFVRGMHNGLAFFQPLNPDLTPNPEYEGDKNNFTSILIPKPEKSEDELLDSGTVDLPPPPPTVKSGVKRLPRKSGVSLDVLDPADTSVTALTLHSTTGGGRFS